MTSSSSVEKVLNRVMVIIFILSISGPPLFFGGFARAHMLLQSYLLNPSIRPFSILPTGDHAASPSWIITSASGEKCTVPFREKVGAMHGPTRSRLPYYFAEEDFMRYGEELTGFPLAEAELYRGGRQATNIELYWVCHLSGCENPVSLKIGDKFWNVNCAEI